jgi:hypothetical protein
MDCTSPPELDTRQLSAYLDGKADQQVMAHLAQCPYCRDQAHRLAGWQDRLITRLYRLTCPKSEELGQYHLGLLEADRRAEVERHLLECPHCTREVAQLENYLRALAPTIEFGPVERVKVLIARLVGGGQGWERPALMPAFAGIRGEADGPFVYQVDDVQIAIEIQDDAEQPGRKIILGLVTGPDATGLKVTLRQADQIVATTSVDHAGNFVIPRLDPGNYQLILIRPEVEIHVQSLKL